jgi:hypothetical protein
VIGQNEDDMRMCSVSVAVGEHVQHSGMGDHDPSGGSSHGISDHTIRSINSVIEPRIQMLVQRNLELEARLEKMESLLEQVCLIHLLCTML